MLATNPIIAKEAILSLVNSKLVAEEPWMKERFLKIIRHFYHHPFFKNFLDLIMTNCKKDLLQFKLHDAKFFDLDEGNCLTMVDKIGLNYIITIKQLAGEVVIHEMAHLLEKELQSFLDLPYFASLVLYDLNNLLPSYSFLEPRLKELFIKALEGYKAANHFSEIFARFFEFFSAAKDIAFDRPRNYLFKDALAVFARSLAWLEATLSKNNWLSLIDPHISQNSQIYLKNNYKFQSFSNKITSKSSLGNSTGARWGVKSNKSDPFS